MLKKYFKPNLSVNSIYDITPQLLAQYGLTALVCDLDNTLVGWDVIYPTKEIKKWLNEMKAANIEIIIVSNNNSQRVAVFCDTLDIPFVANAKKPLNSGFLTAMRQLNAPLSEIGIVGDQLLTDILGANRLHVFNILVNPIKKTDGLITKGNRFIEKQIKRFI